MNFLNRFNSKIKNIKIEIPSDNLIKFDLSPIIRDIKIMKKYNPKITNFLE